MRDDKPNIELLTALVAKALVWTLASLSLAATATVAFTGDWESSALWELETAELSIEVDTTFGVEWNDWSATCRNTLDGGNWKKLDVEVEGPLGSADVGTKVCFEPYKTRFKEWTTGFEWENEGLTLGATSKISRTTKWMTLIAEWESDRLDVDASVRFRAPSGHCSFVFYDAELQASFGLCGIDATWTMSFDDDGLDEIVFEWEGLAPPHLAWLKLDLTWTAGLDEIDVESTTHVELDVEGPLDLEFEASVAATDLAGLSLEELHLDCALSEWEIAVGAYLDPDEWVDHAYSFELVADTEIPLSPCGEVTLEFTFLWAESRLGRAITEFGYSPFDGLILAWTTDLDVEGGGLTSLEWSATMEW